MPLKDIPIRRKLVTIILLTTCAALSLTFVAYSAVGYLTFRQRIRQNLHTLGEVIAANSTAALAFDDEKAESEMLMALKAEPHIVAAGLYNRAGKLVAQYPTNAPTGLLPSSPGTNGFYFARDYLTGFLPVTQGNRVLGALCLKSDLGVMYEQFRLNAGISILVMGASILLAYFLSRALQREVSRPILALLGAARDVSARRDYSIRAAKFSNDELGDLTDSFNQMLGRIERQNSAVIESEARTRAVLDSALSAVVVMDASGKIVDWNERAETMFGWTRAEALGRSLAETIIPLRYREAHQNGLAHFLKTGSGPVLHRLLELSALRRDGGEFPVELSISPIRTGDTTTFCGFITDITERKRLAEARTRLAAIVQTSEDAIMSKSLEGVIMSWNRGAEKLFGYPESEAVGQSMLMLFPPERRDDERQILARIGRNESLEPFETVRIRKDGVRVDVLVTMSPMLNAEGRVVGASTIAHDMTQRKQAEQKLQTQLARLDLLSRTTRAIGERQDLRSILQVVVRSLEDNLPVDFCCVCLYDAVQESLTVTSVGVKSQPVADSLEMARTAVVKIDENGLARCIRGELVYEPDIRETQFPFPQRLARGGLSSVVIAPLLVESQVFGVLVAGRREPNSFSSMDCEFLRQLSEHAALAAHQAQLHDALQRAYNDLRQTQQAVMQQERLRALGQMASGIAHDINNALSPASLYTESLLEKEPNLSDRARDYLRTISRAIDDVAATVARMREFYRQREPQLSLAPVKVNELVQQVLDLTRARWSDMPLQRGAVIESSTSLAADLPVIMGVESEIREALTNLVFNAVDAMPDGGKLEIRTKLSEPAGEAAGTPIARHVHIEVVDTGVGMDEDTRRRCLEPFFTTKGERGTGLGLAMVYGVMQRHSADIEIESAPNKGTTVRLIFAVPAVVVPGAPTVGIVHLVPTRMRLLVVDDDPMLLKSLRDALEGDGHIVTTANNGQTGIEMFREACNSNETFGAVITDLGMPHVDGRMVARAIKAASPDTPVIMLTGWGRRLQAEGDIPPHVDQVLNKPPKLNELREALARCAQKFLG